MTIQVRDPVSFRLCEKMSCTSRLTFLPNVRRAPGSVSVAIRLESHLTSRPPVVSRRNVSRPTTRPAAPSASAETRPSACSRAITPAAPPASSSLRPVSSSETMSASLSAGDALSCD